MFMCIRKVQAFVAFNTIFKAVNGHGYIKTPRSRNYHANLAGKWFGGTESDPAPESCPHCLNIGGTEARCGTIESRNYDLPLNSFGEIMPPVIQACYSPGTIVEFETVLTAHHKGHFEFKACPISHGQVPTQACFDANKLTFVSDVLYGATPDPLYPERAYISRADSAYGSVFSFRHQYRLPEGLSGDIVLIQWHYVTGNSCKDVGYDTYNWPAGFYPGDIPTCTQPLPPDGRGVPEQFWNCAEVKISNSCNVSPVAAQTPVPSTAKTTLGPSDPKPTAPPTTTISSNIKPTTKPSFRPTAIPTFNPTATPTIKPTAMPTAIPTSNPTPTIKPTAMPTVIPTSNPTDTPTIKPTAMPTTKPAALATSKPTANPTAKPTSKPSAIPTTKPSAVPTAKPTTKPSAMPTTKPSAIPTTKPSAIPTTKPSAIPTTKPTAKPTAKPSAMPTTKPSAMPTTKPTTKPTGTPTSRPSF